MTKRMLIDTTHAEETRVVVLDGNRLDDYDVETSAKKQLKGNIYLAKIVRIEPSLQAAFVEYGGNRHGFLAFSEIHPDYYQIPVADRERLIALQEEEARAEEARADESDDGDEDQAPPPPRRQQQRRRHSVETTAEGVPAPQPDDAATDQAPREGVSAQDLFGDAPIAEPTQTGPSPTASSQTMALRTGDAAIYGEPDSHSASEHDAAPRDAVQNEGGAAGTAHDAPQSEAVPHDHDDEPFEHGHAAPGARDQHDDRGHEDHHSDEDASGEGDGPQEPAPETVGGESQTGDDDGRAQRRTARFLRQYKIQEVMRRRQILLIQVVKEERGNKGAALTTYVSLAGRFCVLMPNSLRGGGVSRKITSAADRRRLKEITSELDIPRGMAMIVRTAGAQRPRPEIVRDCEYLLRTWDDIRETTMQSIAPSLVYEEASLIKRAIRDVYTRDIEEIVVDGEAGWKGAREFMRTLMPSNAGKVNLWRDPTQKLFSHYQVEHHLDAMLQPTVQLRSGGYLVINQTEALVAIDVNSGRSTRERGIEETALRTNMEAADEVARQLRLRDLAGLIVIDFIDMEARRNNAMVERRLKDALRNDRARIQVGSISHFGLMEMSRQRLRPSLAESSFVPCPHCAGSGFMRGTESSALHVLRAIEEEAGKRKAAEILVHAASPVALYVLNHKRAWLNEIEAMHQMTVHLAGDDSLIPPLSRIDRVRPYLAPAIAAPVAAPVAPPAARSNEPTRRIPIEQTPPPAERSARTESGAEWVEENQGAAQPAVGANANGPDQIAAEAEEAEHRRKRRRRRRRGGRREDGAPIPEGAAQPDIDDGSLDDQPDTQPTLMPGETLDSPSVFATGDEVAPVVAEASNAPAPEAGTDGARRRGRRGGGRNRQLRPDGDAVVDPAASDENAAPRPLARPPAPRPYNGPTPADPFAGSYDIFEMIERDAETTAAPAFVPNQAASAASFAPATVVPDEPAAVEPPVAPPAEPETSPVVEVPPAEAAAETVQPEPEAQLPLAVATEAETVTDAVVDPLAKPARVAKPRKPRASRAKKPPVVEAGSEPELAVEAAAVTPEPVASIEALPELPPAEAEILPDPKPLPPVAEAASEAEPEAPATPVDPRDPSIVPPVVISDDAPPPARRTGWWKR